MLLSNYANIFRIFEELDLKITFENFCSIAEIKKPIEFYFQELLPNNEAKFLVLWDSQLKHSPEETLFKDFEKKKTKKASKYSLRDLGVNLEQFSEFLFICDNFGIFSVRGLISGIQASHKHLRVLFKRTLQEQLFDIDWIKELKSSLLLEYFRLDLEAGLLDFFIKLPKQQFNFFQNPQAVLILSVSNQLREEYF